MTRQASAQPIALQQYEVCSSRMLTSCPWLRVMLYNIPCRPQFVLLQPGVGLQLGKGAAITIGPIDPQQVNPMYYKQTDETAKFEQVGNLVAQQWKPLIVGTSAAIDCCSKESATTAGIAKWLSCLF
jgi:hypothetical protein